MRVDVLLKGGQRDGQIGKLRGINSLCVSTWILAGRGVGRPSDRPGKGMNSLCASSCLVGRGRRDDQIGQVRE
jgi:hypothetical protein